MKNLPMAAWLLLVIGSLHCVTPHNEKVMIIARQINALAMECSRHSSAEMKEIRIQFLNAHKDSTVKQFVDALNTPINGKNVISLLRELGGDVCNEYADSVEKDKAIGEWALGWRLGEASIQDALRSGLLS